MDDLIKLLHNGHHSLVVANGDVCTFDRRGIVDSYALLCDDPGFLSGAAIADKVVGKGAAALIILGHVAELYTDIISEAALELLNQSSVKVSYRLLVPHITNHNRTGRCPMEIICKDCKSAEECFPCIQAFINNCTNL